MLRGPQPPFLIAEATIRRSVSRGQRLPAGSCPGERPALVQMPSRTGPVAEETVAPVLFVLKHRDLDEAIALQNGGPQARSSSIFGTDILSCTGSDCGSLNANTGTSGAEMGAAL